MGEEGDVSERTHAPVCCACVWGLGGCMRTSALALVRVWSTGSSRPFLIRNGRAPASGYKQCTYQTAAFQLELATALLKMGSLMVKQYQNARERGVGRGGRITVPQF